MENNKEILNSLLKSIYSLLDKKKKMVSRGEDILFLEKNSNFIKLKKLIAKKYFNRQELEILIDSANDVLLNYALHNYSDQLVIATEIDDLINGLYTSINNLGDELNHSTVTKGYLEDIFNSIEDIIIVTDNFGFINFVNIATSKVLKYEDKEILRENIQLIIEQQIPFDKLVDNKFNKTTIRLITKYREVIPVTLSASHFARGDNKGIGYVIIATDESQQILHQKEIEKSNEELKKALEKAEGSDKLKTAFLVNMSHEIKTPLQGIVSFSQLLSQNDFPEDKKKEIAGVVEESSNRLIELVNNILDLSKIETGQVEVKNTAFNLNSLFKDIYNFFKLYSKGKSILISYNVALSDNDSIIYSDRKKIYQIFVNLISNSIKFTEKGDINFGYLIKEDEIEFYVKDTGIGIPKEFHKEIFNRFTQADNSITRNYEGAGLGLSISKGLIEILGGNIWFESEVNKNTHFFFDVPYFPLDEITNNNTNSSNMTVNNLSKVLNILVAEDNNINYMFIEYLFSNSKHKLTRAVNGQNAVDLFNNNKSYDLILMDLNMPIMSGFEATRIIRATESTIPIIAITAYVFEDDIQRALEAGCDDYIVKPYRMDQLFEKISNLIT